jgi:hypothetical protein
LVHSLRPQLAFALHPLQMSHMLHFKGINILHNTPVPLELIRLREAMMMLNIVKAGE